MYKVLLVDDEKIICEGLKSKIPWQANGFDIVGDAANGSDGLKLVQSLNPDIVISDVRMPFIDGLDMVEKIYMKYPHIKTILLSGYDNFDYAKRALNFKVTDYVLKYNYKQDLLSAVIKAKDEIEKERSLSKLVNTENNLMLFKLIHDIMIQPCSEETYRQAGLLGIDLSKEYFSVAIINTNESVDTENEENNVLLTSYVQTALSKAFNKEQGHVYCININRNLAVLFNLVSADGIETVYRAMHIVIKEIKEIKEVKYNAVACLGEIYSGVSRVSQSYHEAITVCEVSKITGQTGVVRFCDISTSENSHNAILKKATDYIQKNYSNKSLSLGSISKEVYISPAYLSTLFKKHMDINLSDYIIKIRIEKAKLLLKNTDLKLYDISERLGYASSQYFSVLFKRCTGLSPTEYKAQCKL